MDNFRSILKEKVLVLDGALGTTIQNYGFQEKDFRGREFLNHPIPILGFNDILNLTKPSYILKIHLDYLEAGANIISTNTFNSNAISMKDFCLEKIDGLVYRINKEGVRLAKEAILEFEKISGNKQHFVAGSIGPTNRSASMSPDITDPLLRNISYSELFDAFSEQIRGLLEGGVDILLFETFFDILNLKAGLDAANSLLIEKGSKLPIMVSATVSDNSGRVLSGQTLEAFVATISHYDNIEVIGINCGFGPDKIKGYIEKINELNSHYTSCHPNAGLPDEAGCYNVKPNDFSNSIKPLLDKGQINIIGGCCGTTPQHIKALSKLVESAIPRKPFKEKEELYLTGLDLLTVKKEFLIIGERCNVAGSAKFLRLIKENKLEEAAEVAKKQILQGAAVLDFNMDDPLLNAKEEMVRFLRYILAEPEIAKVPFMIDSSKWDVIEASLKEIQGKGIVNSISLKEGEEKFLQKAKRIKELGFALVVMAFDEKGQADTYERKVEICKRAYALLTEQCKIRPEDIIFDVNVMTIATGIKEHAKYAIDFLKTIEWIKNNLPGAKTSGGISNLSFAFRGKNKIREYMHTIFLYHAKMRGLDMAIINPAPTTLYENIPNNIKNLIEDIIFDKDESSVERLIEIAQEEESVKKVIEIKDSTSPQSIEDILKDDLKRGEILGLEKDILRALKEIQDPVKIIEGPLLQGMKLVGDLFGEGKMFLPQVVKTARSMKRAVDILTPYLEQKERKNSGMKKGKILIATVKGDVHDIGKNIVSTVLACNNYDIIDLGIMVPPEKIVESALKENPDIICLSGLITPSLGEMTETVKQLSKEGITIPVMVGGAATSRLHTALKIAPNYSGVVLHMTDASQNPIAASRLSNEELRKEYLKEIENEYLRLRGLSKENDQLLPFKEISEIVKKEKCNNYKVKKPDLEIGKEIVLELNLQNLIPLINWKMFFLAWKLKGDFTEKIIASYKKFNRENWVNSMHEMDRIKAGEVYDLYQNAQYLLNTLLENNLFDGKAIFKFEQAKGDVNNIYIGEKKRIFPMLRQQRKDTEFLSCSDFIDREEGYIGLFAVTAGNKLLQLSKKYEEEGDSYRSLITQTLADRIVEASAEWLQDYIGEKFWDITIRPAWGYPMMPDQTLILNTKEFLSYQSIGVSLTENGAMYPPASISGLFISNPSSKYFMIGRIGEDQIKDYAERRNLPEEKVKTILRQL